MSIDLSKVPDDACHKCQLCNASFSMTFRRHHCRVCGRCVCKKCSEHEVPIPVFHVREAIRVCTVSCQHL
ncbi:MAG: FYVE zinc finger domain-containing protein [Proteobacteria bacterium]|nr:FYVE zinc finger domain-containing protein [Pseudomonadota bacterium]